MQHGRVVAAVFTFLAFGWITAANGQTSGTVTGKVRDATGAIIPYAVIGLTNVSTNVGQQTSSTSSGDFDFPIVPVGTYTIAAEKPGFEKATVRDVVVVLGQSTFVDLPLR